MQITTAILAALNTDFSLEFKEGYDATEVWHPKLATQISSTTKSSTYGWVGRVLALREWIGPRIAANLVAHDYVLPNKSFEGTIELDRDELEDDNLGVFKGMALPSLASAAKKHPDQLIAALFAANPAAFDGLSLFNAAHPTFDEPGTTYSNSFALALTAANFSTNWAAMVSYTGEDGQPLMVMPNLLIVPPQLKKTALEIMSSTLIINGAGTAAGENVLKNWADVLVVPELASSPTRWYLADVSKPIKPIVYQLRKPAEFVTRDAPTDPNVFDRKKFLYGVDWRGNVGSSLPFLISRSTP